MVIVVPQVQLLQTKGATRATGGRDAAARTGGRDDAARVRVAEVRVRTGVRPISVVGWFVSLLRLLVWT